MTGRVTAFGELPSGETVSRVEIAAGGLSASILTYGAVIQELRFNGFERSLVLGLETLEHYIELSPCFGAIVGRLANRLSFGEFVLNGHRYSTDRNIDGTHTLHGGSGGFSFRNWKLKELGDDFVTLEFRSPDDDMGFPGNMVAICTYRIIPENILRIELSAIADAATPCNFAPHSYFNLEGEGNILDHELIIAASRTADINDHLIPTGGLLPVEGTQFDFQKLRKVADGPADGRIRFDHNYCLSDETVPMRDVAFLKAPRSRIAMKLSTTQPGLQFYDGAKIDVPVSGIDEREYGANAGLCLETQHWPDAPNRPEFPSVILASGKRYSHITEYAFTRHPVD